MTFLDELQKETNTTHTENGAVTNKSSLNANLDFFALAGAMRSDMDEAVRLFARAYATDKQTTIRTLFYLRDIRGGQGERAIFRRCLEELKAIDRKVFESVVEHIPEYGRWDDVPIDPSTVNMIAAQLKEDEDAFGMPYMQVRILPPPWGVGELAQPRLNSV